MLIPLSRRIVNKNSLKIIGRIASFKMAGQLAWESTLERDFLLLLEADPDVATIVAQPEPLYIWIEGRRHRYTPDMLVTWVDPDYPNTYFEVKPNQKATGPEWVALFQAVTRHLAALGREFKVIRESDIRGTPTFANARRLRMYAGLRPAWGLLSIIEGLLPCAFHTLKSRFEDDLPALLNLLFHGELYFDRTRLLGDETIISVGQRRPRWN